MVQKTVLGRKVKRSNLAKGKHTSRCLAINYKGQQMYRIAFRRSYKKLCARDEAVAELML